MPRLGAADRCGGGLAPGCIGMRLCPYAPDHDARPSPMSPPIPIVFVVDDDVSVRESLELLIRHEGWLPQTFATAEAFLARPQVAVPSCLVLDVTLPDLNGLDLQKRIAADRVEMP